MTYSEDFKKKVRAQIDTVVAGKMKPTVLVDDIWQKHLASFRNGQRSCKDCNPTAKPQS
jgi:hypothetical protein